MFPAASEIWETINKSHYGWVRPAYDHLLANGRHPDDVLFIGWERHELRLDSIHENRKLFHVLEGTFGINPQHPSLVALNTAWQQAAIETFVPTSSHAKDRFPTRAQIENDKNPIGLGCSTLGGNVLVFTPGHTQHKAVMVYRDAKASYPNCWATFGGFCTEAPSLTAEKELREEFGFFLQVAGQQKYWLLRPNLPTSNPKPQNALSEDDVQRAAIRAKFHWGEHFRENWPIEQKEISLQKFRDINRLESDIDIIDTQTLKTIDRVTGVHIYRPPNHVSLYQVVSLPPQIDGADVSDMRTGENCFPVDIEIIPDLEHGRRVDTLDKHQLWKAEALALMSDQPSGRLDDSHAVISLMRQKGLIF